MKTNLKNMAWMLAATLVMAACSDSLDESSNTGQGPLTGEGYVKVAINMPSTSGTRAFNEGTDLVDGLADEYKVNSGIIAFFKANVSEDSPDANATFVKAYSLNSLTQQDDNNADPQVSTRVTITTEAPLVGTTEQLYALVILNPNKSVVSVNSTSGVLTVGTTPLTSTSTLAALQTKLENQALTNYTGTNNDAFLMTNAPLSNLPGNSQELSSATAKILVPVTVHETKAAAEGDKDPARIYVERVVAKVTLTGFDYDEDNSEYTKKATVSTTKPNGDTESVYNGDIVKLDGWVLTVTNKSTKLVRDVSDFSNWLATDNSNNASRFVGTSVITMAGSQSYYRIYWAEDENYRTNDTDHTNDFTTYSKTNSPANWHPEAERPSSSSPLYCLENTMNYDEQINNRTTSVLLKTEYRVKFFDGDQPSARDFYICGTSPKKYPKEKITIDAQAGTTIQGIVEYVETTASVSDLALQDVDGGIYEGASGMQALFKKTNGTLSEDDAKKIWNAVGPIKYYKNGEGYYYAALIRHFSDTEANWKAGDDYGLKHLGRYGVVRNNWYDITINSINGPGDPEIISPSGSPDDEAKGYINCTINVLSWAKRSQGVDL